MREAIVRAVDQMVDARALELLVKADDRSWLEAGQKAMRDLIRQITREPDAHSEITLIAPEFDAPIIVPAKNPEILALDRMGLDTKEWGKAVNQELLSSLGFELRGPTPQEITEVKEKLRSHLLEPPNK